MLFLFFVSFVATFSLRLLAATVLIVTAMVLVINKAREIRRRREREKKYKYIALLCLFRKVFWPQLLPGAILEV